MQTLKPATIINIFKICLRSHRYLVVVERKCWIRGLSQATPCVARWCLHFLFYYTQFDYELPPMRLAKSDTFTAIMGRWRRECEGLIATSTDLCESLRQSSIWDWTWGEDDTMLTSMKSAVRRLLLRVRLHFRMTHIARWKLRVYSINALLISMAYIETTHKDKILFNSALGDASMLLTSSRGHHIKFK